MSPPLAAAALLGLVNRLLLQGGMWFSIGAALAAAAVLGDFQLPEFRPVLFTIGAGVLGLLLRWREKAEAATMGTVPIRMGPREWGYPIVTAIGASQELSLISSQMCMRCVRPLRPPRMA